MPEADIEWHQVVIENLPFPFEYEFADYFAEMAQNLTPQQLAQVQAEVQAYIAAHPPAAPAAAAAAPRVNGNQLTGIKPFTGKEDGSIELFVSSLQGAGRTFGWDDACLAAAAKQRLDGDAAAWMMANEKQNLMYNGWDGDDGLKKALMTRFFPAITEAESASAIASIREQHAGESVQRYYDRIRLAIDRSHIAWPDAIKAAPGYAEVVQHQIFTYMAAGLKQSIREQTMGSAAPPRTAAALLTAAKAVEADQRGHAKRGGVLADPLLLELGAIPDEAGAAAAADNQGANAIEAIVQKQLAAFGFGRGRGRGGNRGRGFIHGRGRGRGNATFSRRCYNCDGEGHFAKECKIAAADVEAFKQARKRRGGRGFNAKRGGRKKTGYWAKYKHLTEVEKYDATQAHKLLEELGIEFEDQDENDADVVDEIYEEDELHGFDLLREVNEINLYKPYNRPLINTNIEGIKVKALFDSGAEKSAISHDIWKQIIRQKPMLKELLVPCKVRLLTAGKTVLKLIGQVKMTLIYESNDGIRRTTHDFIIVDNLNQKALIGVDLMGKQKIVINTHNGTISHEKEYMRKRRVIKNEINELKSVASCTVETSCCIKEDETKFVRIKFPDECAEWKEAHILGLTRTFADKLFLEEQFIKVEQPKGYGKIRITNFNPFPVTLERKQDICLATQIDPVHKEKELNEVVKGSTKNGRYQENWQQASVRPPSEGEIRIRKQRNAKLLDKFDVSHLPHEYRIKFEALLKEYLDVFSFDEFDVGKCPVFPQVIEWKDPKKICFVPTRPMSPQMLKIAHHLVDKWLASGIVVPSRSPHSSPIHLVAKPKVNDETAPISERWRCVLDLRQCNTHIVKDCYPLPHLQDLVHLVAAKKYVSTFDLRDGFYNQQLSPESQQYSAFSVPQKGHMHFTRSPQGSINSMCSFQRMIEYCFQNTTGVHLYADDVCGS